MRFHLTTTLWIGSFVAVFALLVNPAVADDWSDTDVFVAPDEAADLIDQGATVLDARESDDVRQGHIRGASNLHWQQFVDGSASGELIDDDRRLTALLQQAGVSNGTPVVIYGNWSRQGAWGEEGRLYWTLDYLGHSEVYILSGGVEGWQQSQRPLTRGETARGSAGDFEIARRKQLRTVTDQLYRELHNGNGLVVLDSREAIEYQGQIKYGEQRPGHIPGAQHLWWRDLFDDDGDLKSRSEIAEKLSQRGIDADSKIVAYCTGGIRSGFVYSVLRAKGLNVSNYDASMWDWSRHDALPLQK